MSDPVGYIALSVIGPDTAAALAWLDRQVAWEHRLRQLEDGDPKIVAEPPDATGPTRRRRPRRAA